MLEILIAILFVLMFFPQFKIFIVCQTQILNSRCWVTMSEIASKKKRNEFLISSAEKKV